MINRRFLAVSFWGCCAIMAYSQQIGEVKLEEKVYNIPSYQQNPPNVMPRFYEGKSHQGVQRRIYPYPFDDGLTANKRDMEHPMIHIENDYIDLAISTELGGRIYYADDKTNQYNYLYHNHVVKPSLIGMQGNWISGSLAWGYPHHHGSNTVEKMAYQIEEKEDGSKTVWIRSWDRLHRMEVVIGYTVYPGSSIIEMTIHPKNRTAISNSFLFWANPAVHCDSAYQVIFPPSVKYVTFHGKNQMTSWPIADSWFNGYDFAGMDISYWKNTHVPSSFFSWNPQEDYFCGYDHNKEAGTAWIGNHYICPGMKYWADGNNPNGLKTNEGLTDVDGRYIELMAGFYTDNQPDYSWLQPYETKIGKMVWFPIRELGGLKYANRKGALNYFIKGDLLDLRLNSTELVKDAEVIVVASGKDIYRKKVTISPAIPQKIECSLPEGIGELDLKMSLCNSQGRVLLEYEPAAYMTVDEKRPEPLKPFAKPKEMKSVEELYLAGLRLEQFYNASVDPMPYYEEALARDPENYDVNTQLGIRCIKRYDREGAERYLRTAVKRIISNYTRPKDGEALYYLGVVLRAQGKNKEAYDCFYRASWSSAWHTASYFQLASLDCMNKDYKTALYHLDLSISTNVDNMRAIDLKAYVLRLLGQRNDAKSLLVQALDTCKIDLMAQNELYNIDGEISALDKLDKWLLDDVQLYTELSLEYAQISAYKEAADILKRLEQKGNTYPMLYYTLGYYAEKQNNKQEALSYYKKAESMPSDYCYPFRWEEIPILESAMRMNADDAKAAYYLGNLYFEYQPQKAIALWEESLKKDSEFYIAWRNLALAYQKYGKDDAKALVYMKNAFERNKKDARLLFELDELNDANKLCTKEKYELLKKNFSVGKQRPETVLRMATRAMENGNYKEALKIMDENFIIESEGAREQQDNYLNSYLILAMQCSAKGRYKEANSYLDKALNYPIGLYGRSVYAKIYYIAGSVYEQQRLMDKAKVMYDKVMDVNVEKDTEAIYYKAMALQKQGEEVNANTLLNDILKNLDKETNSFFSQFGESNVKVDKRKSARLYYEGLAYEGLGKKDMAIRKYKEALLMNPANVWSKVHLNFMD